MILDHRQQKKTEINANAPINLSYRVDCLPPYPVYSEADIEEVKSIVIKSGTSFTKGMRLLKGNRRNSIYGIYAFCRIIDDIADSDALFTNEKLSYLGEWRQIIEKLYEEGCADNAVQRILLNAIHTYHLKKEDFIAVIDGMQMDVEVPIIAPDQATFDLYCDKVASAVGRLSIRIFGDSSMDAYMVAHHLGRALQITNVLRDINEDALRNRLYLPRELLEKFRIPCTPEKIIYHPSLNLLCPILAARAMDHFRNARTYMSKCKQNAMKPAHLMALMYEAILKTQIKRGWSSKGDRVSLSPLQKCSIIFRSFFV